MSKPQDWYCGNCEQKDKSDCMDLEPTDNCWRPMGCLLVWEEKPTWRTRIDRVFGGTLLVIDERIEK